MNRIGTWIPVGVIALVGLIVGLSQLPAQRFGQPGGGEVGRYVVVRATPDIIILLDTVTGSLYNALPSDIKPWAQRGGPPTGLRPAEKDFDRFEKKRDFEKEPGFERKEKEEKRRDSKEFEKKKERDFKGDFDKK